MLDNYCMYCTILALTKMLQNNTSTDSGGGWMLKNSSSSRYTRPGLISALAGWVEPWELTDIYANISSLYPPTYTLFLGIYMRVFQI